MKQQLEQVLRTSGRYYQDSQVSSQMIVEMLGIFPLEVSFLGMAKSWESTCSSSRSSNHRNLFVFFFNVPNNSVFGVFTS